MLAEITSSTLDMLTSPETLVPVLTQTRLLLIASLAGVLFNAFLLDRAVFEGLGQVRSERFDRWDALLGSLLVGFFLYLVVSAMGRGDSSASDAEPKTMDIIANMIAIALLFFLLITGILTALRLRRISWRETFGLTRLSVWGIVGRAVILLMLAYPMIEISSAVTQAVLTLGGAKDEGTQDLVKFFVHSDSPAAKWAIAISAMIIAPMQEEFLFRGYIHGVIRRYGGVTLAVLLNSALFALIHLHLPSFVPLFILAVCLSLAYEWTGCLWVPMCMHAMFNSVTVINLFFLKQDL